jgi:broad specificity phosphatase PhoE
VTTTFFLVRHAAHDNVGGFLAGRRPGISLGEAGQAQARRVAERLRRESFEAIHSSPRERAAETAAAIAAVTHVPVERADELDEIDFGTWSGRTFDDLEGDPAWRHWNAQRSLAQTPAGDTMLAVEGRIIGLMQRLANRHPDGALVLVSHADVIRAGVGYLLGLPIDAWPRFDIGPGSVTTLILGDWGARLLTLNEVVV